MFPSLVSLIMDTHKWSMCLRGQCADLFMTLVVASHLRGYADRPWIQAASSLPAPVGWGSVVDMSSMGCEAVATTGPTHVVNFYRRLHLPSMKEGLDRRWHAEADTAKRFPREVNADGDGKSDWSAEVDHIFCPSIIVTELPPATYKEI